MLSSGLSAVADSSRYASQSFIQEGMAIKKFIVTQSLQIISQDFERLVICFPTADVCVKLCITEIDFLISNP